MRISDCSRFTAESEVRGVEQPQVARAFILDGVRPAEWHGYRDSARPRERSTPNLGALAGVPVKRPRIGIRHRDYFCLHPVVVVAADRPGPNAGDVYVPYLVHQIENFTKDGKAKSALVRGIG